MSENRLPPDEQTGPELVPDSGAEESREAQPAPPPLDSGQRLDNLEFLMFRLLMEVTKPEGPVSASSLLMSPGVDPMGAQPKEISPDLAAAREHMQNIILQVEQRVWVPGLLHVARLTIENFRPEGAE